MTPTEPTEFIAALKGVFDYERAKKNGPKLKAMLTRALHVEGDKEKTAAVIKACMRAVQEWNLWGAWPDGWARWQCALRDVTHSTMTLEEL
jgi:hypothetical protein